MLDVKMNVEYVPPKTLLCTMPNIPNLTIEIRQTEIQKITCYVISGFPGCTVFPGKKPLVVCRDRKSAKECVIKIFRSLT